MKFARDRTYTQLHTYTYYNKGLSSWLIVLHYAFSAIYFGMLCSLTAVLLRLSWLYYYSSEGTCCNFFLDWEWIFLNWPKEESVLCSMQKRVMNVNKTSLFLSLSLFFLFFLHVYIHPSYCIPMLQTNKRELLKSFEELL